VQCPVSGQEYDVNDVADLTCSVEYSGHTEPLLMWTDNRAIRLDTANDNTISTVSSVYVAL